METDIKEYNGFWHNQKKKINITKSDKNKMDKNNSVVPKSTFRLYHILLYLFPSCHFPFPGCIRSYYIYFCYNRFQLHVISFYVLCDSVILSSVICNSHLAIWNLLFIWFCYFKNLLYPIHCGLFLVLLWSQEYYIFSVENHLL